MKIIKNNVKKGMANKYSIAIAIYIIYIHTVY